jgi:hypothetical protein
MRKVLDDSIPGFLAWSMKHYGAGVHETISHLGQKLPSIVFGDFNRDSIADVVIDGTEGHRFLRVALVSRGDTYRLHVLHDRPVADQLRGESIEFLVYQAPGTIDTLACGEQDNDMCHPSPFNLTSDAFQAVFLEKAASLYHWTGDGFAESGTSD